MSAILFRDYRNLPLIRKVFRQNDAFICGLCKSDYPNYGEANSCMNQCWFDVHNFYPVVRKKLDAQHWVFRCLFCCRDHTSDAEAYSCAVRCREDRNKAQLREQILNDRPLPPPSRPVSRLMMLARMPVPQPKKKKVKAKKAVIKEVMIATEIDRRKEKKSYLKPWIRKGEKYQCMHCKSVHYTKLEGQNCFDSHFDAEGFEIMAAPEAKVDAAS